MEKMLVVASLLGWGALLMLSRAITLLYGDLANRMTYWLRGSPKVPGWARFSVVLLCLNTIALWVFRPSGFPYSRWIIPGLFTLLSLALIWLVVDWADLRVRWINILLQTPHVLVARFKRLLWFLFALGWAFLICGAWLASR